MLSKDEKSDKERRVKEYLEEYDRVNRPESLASIYKRVEIGEECHVDEGGRKGGTGERHVFARLHFQKRQSETLQSHLRRRHVFQHGKSEESLRRCEILGWIHVVLCFFPNSSVSVHYRLFRRLRISSPPEGRAAAWFCWTPAASSTFCPTGAAMPGFDAATSICAFARRASALSYT